MNVGICDSVDVGLLLTSQSSVWGIAAASMFDDQRWQLKANFKERGPGQHFSASKASANKKNAFEEYRLLQRLLPS